MQGDESLVRVIRRSYLYGRGHFIVCSPILSVLTCNFFPDLSQCLQIQRPTASANASLHNYKGKTLGGGSREAPTEGAEFDFAQLKGKVVLINNVATM